MTGILATVFFVTSFGLAIIAKDNAKVGDEILPELETVQEVLESELPAVETLDDASSDIPVLEDEATVSAEEIPVFGNRRISEPGSKNRKYK